MSNAKTLIIVFSVFLISCTNVESIINEEIINKDIVGYEFLTENEYFITIEDDECFLRIPRDKDDPMRKFIGIPTLDEFRLETWDESKYIGSDKYMSILPKGVMVRIIDVVKSINPEVGITYDYYAIIDGLDACRGKKININSLVDE